MSVFRSILVPLDGSAAAAQSLGCALWLASRLGAELHILSAGMPMQLPKEALARLKVPENARAHVTVHQGLRAPEIEILAAIERYAIDLIAMTARGETTERSQTRAEERAKLVGHVTEAIIERSPVPVLLIPLRYEEGLPWETVLVPMSGEPGPDAALMLTVRLANALSLKVHIVHVVDSEASEAAMGCYCDQAHHEYPQMLNEFITRACPLCSPAETRCIEEFSLTRGDAAAEILRLAHAKDASLLIVGWHGQFTQGHAQVLKRLCQSCSVPVLLVKPAAKTPFKLKVGPELEE